MVSELKEPLADILEKTIVFKPKFIRQILDFLPPDFDGGRTSLKYLNSLQIMILVHKHLEKYSKSTPKNGSDNCLQKSAVT